MSESRRDSRYIFLGFRAFNLPFIVSEVREMVFSPLVLTSRAGGFRPMGSTGSQILHFRSDRRR